MFTHASQCVTKKKYSNVIHYCVQVVREKTNRNKIKKWCHDSWASIVIGQDNWLGLVPAVNQWWLLGEPTWPLRLRLSNGENGGLLPASISGRNSGWASRCGGGWSSQLCFSSWVPQDGDWTSGFSRCSWQCACLFRISFWNHAFSKYYFYV